MDRRRDSTLKLILLLVLGGLGKEVEEDEERGVEEEVTVEDWEETRWEGESEGRDTAWTIGSVPPLSLQESRSLPSLQSTSSVRQKKA